MITLFETYFAADYLFGEMPYNFVSDRIDSESEDEIVDEMLELFCERFAGDALNFGDEIKEVVHDCLVEFVSNVQTEGELANAGDNYIIDEKVKINFCIYDDIVELNLYVI